MTTKKFLLWLLGIIVIALAVPFFYHPEGVHQKGPGMPWEVAVQPDGSSQVFGLTVGKTTIAEAAAKLREQPQMAIVASPGHDGVLEAYFEAVNLGIITGKLLLTGDLPHATLLEMKRRATKEVPLATGAHRFDLTQADWQAVHDAPISSITLILNVSLDEAAILNRFGRPGEQHQTADKTTHFLYPERGIDVAMSEKGKVLVQYILPAQFARLRDPLFKEELAPAQ